MTFKVHDLQMTPEQFLKTWRSHMVRAFCEAEWVESAVDIFADLERAFAAAREESAANERKESTRRHLALLREIDTVRTLLYTGNAIVEARRAFRGVEELVRTQLSLLPPPTPIESQVSGVGEMANARGNSCRQDDCAVIRLEGSSPSHPTAFIPDKAIVRNEGHGHTTVEIVQGGFKPVTCTCDCGDSKCFGSHPCASCDGCQDCGATDKLFTDAGEPTPYCWPRCAVSK